MSISFLSDVFIMPPKSRQPALASQHGAQSEPSSSVIRINSSLSKIRKSRATKKQISQPVAKALKKIIRRKDSNPQLLITDKRNVSINTTDLNSSIEPLDHSSPGRLPFNVPPSNLVSIDDQLLNLDQACKDIQSQYERLIELRRQANLASSNISNYNSRERACSPVSPNRQSTSLDRSLDRMLRHMPEFNGKPDDNFESYLIGVEDALVYGIGCTEAQRFNAVKVKIGGDAREVLAHCGIINSVTDLLAAMHQTYGKDQRSLIADVKQKISEPVRVFALRLRSILKILGWGHHDSQKPNLVSLEFFLNGLLPSLATEVKKMLPQTLEIAIQPCYGQTRSD